MFSRNYLKNALPSTFLASVEKGSDFLRHIFFPPRCAACSGRIPMGALCDPCRGGVTLNRTLFCGTCGLRLPEGVKVCHKNAPYILGAAASYDHPAIRSLIHNLKFRRNRDCAPPLADFIASYFGEISIDLSAYAIVPLPLSSRRERERGFNQSELIARSLADMIGNPFCADLLARTRHTARQSDTNDARERRMNVAGAFRARENLAAHPNILLIDDVTTSGATFREAASALKLAGAKKIIAVAAARA